MKRDVFLIEAINPAHSQWLRDCNSKEAKAETTWEYHTMPRELSGWLFQPQKRARGTENRSSGVTLDPLGGGRRRGWRPPRTAPILGDEDIGGRYHLHVAVTAQLEQVLAKHG